MSLFKSFSHYCHSTCALGWRNTVYVSIFSGLRIRSVCSSGVIGFSVKAEPQYQKPGEESADPGDQEGAVINSQDVENADLLVLDDHNNHCAVPEPAVRKVAEAQIPGQPDGCRMS